MQNRVWQYITEQKLLNAARHVGVAVSGGSDSMALLHCMAELAGTHGFTISCVHFEHGIRGKRSLLDAEFVEQYCDEHDIPLFMGAADVPALAKEWCMGEESAAKRAREEYFDSLVAAGDVDLIATGHHIDDNAESVLMHILRGSGMDGLIGIHAKYGSYIRPFLCVTRARILQYIEQMGIPYVTDETNADSRYMRNYVRNELMPRIAENINSDAAAALNRLSLLAEQDVQYLSHRADQAFERIARVERESVRIDAQALTGLHPAIAGRVIRRACARLHIVQDIELVHVDAVLELAKNGRTGAKANLVRSLMAEMEYGTLVLGFLGRRVNYSFELPLNLSGVTRLPDGSTIECGIADEYDAQNTDPGCECFDLDKLPQKPMVRTRHTGDVIKPLSGGTKKLKDYFIDLKLPRDEREKTPLVADGGNIIWVIGHVISDAYKVDAGTRRIVRMCHRATPK